MRIHSSSIQKRKSGTYYDEISNINKRRAHISDSGVKDGESNNGNVKYSIEESENNSGSFNLLSKETAQDNSDIRYSKGSQSWLKHIKIKKITITNNNFEKIYEQKKPSTNISSQSASTKRIPSQKGDVNTNTKYSIEESENNSGSFNLSSKETTQDNSDIRYSKVNQF